MTAEDKERIKRISRSRTDVCIYNYDCHRCIIHKCYETYFYTACRIAARQIKRKLKDTGEW